VASLNWVAYSLLCLMLWGLWGLALKIASRSLTWVEVYFLSSLASFTLATTVFLVIKRSVDLGNKLVYTALVAGLLGGSGYLALVKALESGKASVVIPLTALYPAVTAILAVIVLSEKLTITQAVGVVLAIAAVVLLSIE